MREQSIYKRAVLLAVPMMIQNGITNMVGLIDNVMVGSLGTESMTAVSIVGQLLFVFNLAVFGGISGPGIYGAQYYGQGNEEGFRNTFRMKIWICLACVMIGTFAFFLGGREMIGLYLHGESETVNAALTLELGWQYMLIMIVTLLPFSVTQIYASSLRETGESVKPMVAGVISVFVDIVFNYLLIYGKFGFPQMGVRGAALATVLARVTECVIVVAWSHAAAKKHTFLQGIYRTVLIPGNMCVTMVKKGLPIFFNEFLWAGGMAALTQCYSMRGLDAVAAMNISTTISNLFNVVFVAMGSALSIIVGQLLGAGKMEEARDTDRKLIAFAVMSCLVLGTLMVLLAPLFPMLYNTTDQIKALATVLLRMAALCMPMWAFMHTTYFTLRSGGKTIVTFLFDSVFLWCASIPVAYVLSRYTALPIAPLYLCCQLLDLIKCVIGFVLVKKGVWIRNIVGER